jgi:fimbrial isopeptide formation D2 family protein/LPXTG-motif cell wall-anchored protein
MKTTKKIFAGILSAAMIATMVPFAASAAETTYSVDLTGKTGYTYSLYKVAGINTTTMEYTNIYDNSAVKSALTTTKTENGDISGVDSAALLTACDNAGFTDANKVATFTTVYNNENIEAGVYYVKLTAAPSGVDSTNISNSVFAVPYYEGATLKTSVTADISTKVEDKTPTVNKVFTNDKTATSITEFENTSISYTLTGSVIGSVDEKATSYSFVDTMTKGLTYDAITSVKLTGNDDADDKTLTANTDYTANFANQVLTVALTDKVLNDASFYSYTTVEVVYTAHLNENAVIGVKTESEDVQNAVVGETDLSKLTFANNVNSVNLVYANKYTPVGDTETIYGPKRTVYTFELNVVKVDGNNTATKLAGAEFKLSGNNIAKEITLATDADGKVTFTGLKAGTYTVQETKAPSGYNLNSTVFTVTISDDGTVTSDGNTITELTVNDYPLLTPLTGGTGTMVFTVVGISLIACAGVLLLIVMKKKKASK